MNQQTCPERQRIADYLLGLLDDDESDEIRSHTAECPDCEAAATKLESVDDAFIRLLRRPEPEPSFLDEPQWQEAVSRAAAIQTWGITEPDQSTGGALDTAGGPAISPPAYLGEYEIVRLIGKGGMGAVYEARHTKLKRTVAIKLLPDRVANEDQAIRRFEREMEAVGGLKHPNIVQAHDAREIDGTRFLVMEYVEGQDLGEMVKAGGRLPGETACRLVREAAEALAYAHEHGLVHRDVKPSNLMLAADGSIKVLDLGLAKIQEQEARDITNSGQLMGTVDYMAPEQGTDSHQVDHRADIYSLGCTLFHLLAGQPPYGKRSVREVFFAHISAPVPSLLDARPEAPPTLDALIQKMMAKQPADRPQTMEEVATALREFESSECWPVETEEEEALELAPATPIVAAGTAAEPDSDRSVAPVKPQASGGKRRPPTIAMAAGGAAAFLLLLGILITIRTPNGTIEIEVDQPGAQVAVDGEVVMLTSPGEPEPIEVKAAKGGHMLVVSKGGFKTHTESFTIASGDRRVFEVRLVPSEEEVDRRTEVGSGKGA
jgi:serine/threonine protein kinase